MVLEDNFFPFKIKRKEFPVKELFAIIPYSIPAQDSDTTKMIIFLQSKIFSQCQISHSVGNKEKIKKIRLPVGR